MTRVRIPEPTERKERTDSSRLLADFHKLAMGHVGMDAYTHANNCEKLSLPEKVP